MFCQTLCCSPTVIRPTYLLTQIYLPKLKPFLVGLLYRPPDKIDLINCIDQISLQSNKLKTQECYLLGDSNIHSPFKGEEIFGNKIAKKAYEEMLPLTKKYLEFFFSNSSEQTITSLIEQ